VLGAGGEREAGGRELLVFIYMLKRELKKVKMGEVLRDELVNSMTCTSIVSVSSYLLLS
jgi:hypothetical protein